MSLDAASPPDTVRPDAARAAVVKAARVWADGLIDQTRRNELLYCKDKGKVVLDDADERARTRLLRSEPVRLRQLFPDPARFADAAKTAESIRRRIKEYDEERGVRIGRLISGFATWRDMNGKGPVRAPVLLREVTVIRKPGHDDYEIVADRDIEISPVILHHLRSSFGVVVDADLLAELNDLVDDPDRVAEGLDRLMAALADVPELRIDPGSLLGTFHYAKLAMYQDLVENAEAFATNELVAAMAGDVAAIDLIRAPVGEVTIEQPDRTPPADEFLVLDADPSQNYVINAAVAGRNLVVQGPPGTGKSQTISNLISTLAARGRSVLFVAEKRAAIDAVVGRLAAAGLGDLTLDLHVTTANRSRVYEQFRTAIAAAASVAPADFGRLHAQLERARAAVAGHDIAMNDTRAPWGISLYEAQSQTLALAPELRPDVRLAPESLDRLHGITLDEVRESLAAFAAADGLLPSASRGPWANATFDSDAHAQRAVQLIRNLRAGLGELRRLTVELATRAGLPQPQSAAHAVDLVRLCVRTNAVAARWQPAVYEADLPRLLAASGDRAYREKAGIAIGWFGRWRLKRQARALRLTGTGDLHAELAEIEAVAGQWWEAARIRPPRTVDAAAAEAVSQPAAADLAELGELLRADLAALHWPDLATFLDLLAADPSAPSRVARINRMAGELRAAGLGDLIAWLEFSAPGWTAEERPQRAVAAFDHVWHASIVESVLLGDSALAAFDGAAHATVVAAFQDADRQHGVSTRQRVRRTVAERLTEVRTGNRDQDLFLDKELSRKRGLKPLRDLVQAAPEILLAARPCWAMSPLLVSQLLPATRLFDVVIFDEASQVRPAEAIPSLARARAAVIAGDSKQLPPTAFFMGAVSDEEDTEVDESDLLTQDVESVLEAFNRALGGALASEYALRWHYRSQDSRLIAPSNAFFYGNQMTTFAGTAVESPIDLVVVPEAVSAEGTSVAEVNRVVDLMLEHAQQRPHLSLGVIAMGINHANAIDDELNRRLRADPQLRGWFEEPRAEPYFVKNLEKVQGDERDAIILAIGYGRTADGRMSYNFGPINQQGGQRRLNVAITRAKRRMTVVAGFTPDDLDPARLKAEGPRRLADYLRYVSDGCRTVAGTAPELAPLNPFELEVRDRLAAGGVAVETRVGSAGYFIDFAAAHPQRPGRRVLAIETDGTTYHDAPTTRSRDRLRQEQLERLGWRFHRLWSRDWFRDPDREIAKLRAAFDAAVAAVDAADADSVPAAPPAAGSTPAGTPATVVPEPVTPERGRRPAIGRGGSIDDYTDDGLTELVAWIASDGRLRTESELADEARAELGFRHGRRIDERIAAAVARYRAHA